MQKSYPILGVADDLHHVSFCSGKKGWMDRRYFRAMLLEERFLTRDLQNREQIIYLDNVSSHDKTNEVHDVLQEKCTCLSYLPRSTTYKVQPLDTGILKIFKDGWRKNGPTKNW